MDKTARAMAILRGMDKTAKGFLGGLSESVKSIDALGKGMSKALAGRGHGRAAMAVRFLPHAAVAYGGKKIYDVAGQTRTMQKLKHWHQRRQYEKALRQAQAQQGGYY